MNNDRTCFFLDPRSKDGAISRSTDALPSWVQYRLKYYGPRKMPLMYSIYMLVTTRAWPLVPNIRCVYAKAVDFPIGFAEIGGVIVDKVRTGAITTLAAG